jgi:hypothetical protein
MASVKVEDDTIWNDYVKTGKVKGFFEFQSALRPNMDKGLKQLAKMKYFNHCTLSNSTIFSL